MTQEEKAKLYDEAIEVAQRFYNNSVAITKKVLEDIFPELKESEDEEIREMLKVAVERTPWMQDKKEKCYEWLEKQGEQKPDKIEPKFKVGDEIKTANEESLTITKIDEKGYWSEDLFICGFDDAAKWELVGQKPAWSEEDEQTFIKSVEALEDSYNFMLADWLKEHKNQFLRPQNKWKPSDEQMKALKEAVDEHFDIDGGALWHLYEDLKKLKS